MTARKGFTPRFVLTRTPRGTLRSLSVSMPLVDPYPDVLEEAMGIDYPYRADVILRQTGDAASPWRLEDRLQQPLTPTTYATRDKAEGAALVLATDRAGRLWLRSDVPPRFDRL